ncbi:MAG: BamA/TamA family outer membrane protein, partial [Acidimicrobiales bacterium]
MTLGRVIATAAVTVTAAFGPARGAAQSTVTVTPGPEYSAGWLHRLFMGTHYRDLWTTPIAVEVLDLDRTGGGLAPTRCGGGRQTTSVRFRAPGGREYAFRSVDKDPLLVLPEELRRTFAADVLQDQISSAHPAAPLVVAPLLEAAGVLHAPPVMWVLPDEPRLRSLPCGRPGMIGMLEERPT